MPEAHNKIAVSPSPREAGNGWVLDAVFPNGKQAAIAGFRTESEANKWLGSARHLTWLCKPPATFGGRSAIEIFEWLVSCAIAASGTICAFCKSIRHSWRDMEAVRLAYRSISAISAQLIASAWLCRASDLARRIIERRGAGQSSSFRHRTVYRWLLAATVAFLIFIIVLGISIAVLVTFGDSERPTRLSSRAMQFASDSPIVPPRSSEVTRESDPIALLLDRVSSSETAAELPIEPIAATTSPPFAGDEGPAGEIHAASPRRELPRTAPPAIVGVWAPETRSCSAREGVLPAIISEHGARAGETSCVFKEQRWTERDFRLRANCTNGHEHWTSNVHLIVKGDRLVWTSKRGAQAYIRCKLNS